MLSIAKSSPLVSWEQRLSTYSIGSIVPGTNWVYLEWVMNSWIIDDLHFLLSSCFFCISSFSIVKYFYNQKKVIRFFFKVIIFYVLSLVFRYYVTFQVLCFGVCNYLCPPRPKDAFETLFWSFHAGTIFSVKLGVLPLLKAWSGGPHRISVMYLIFSLCSLNIVIAQEYCYFSRS